MSTTEMPTHNTNENNPSPEAHKSLAEIVEDFIENYGQTSKDYTFQDQKQYKALVDQHEQVGEQLEKSVLGLLYFMIYYNSEVNLRDVADAWFSLTQNQDEREDLVYRYENFLGLQSEQDRAAYILMLKHDEYDQSLSSEPNCQQGYVPIDRSGKPIYPNHPLYELVNGYDALLLSPLAVYYYYMEVKGYKKNVIERDLTGENASQAIEQYFAAYVDWLKDPDPKELAGVKDALAKTQDELESLDESKNRAASEAREEYSQAHAALKEVVGKWIEGANASDIRNPYTHIKEKIKELYKRIYKAKYPQHGENKVDSFVEKMLSDTKISVNKKNDLATAILLTLTGSGGYTDLGGVFLAAPDRFLKDSDQTD